MRTTLSLDDEVAALLDRARRERRASLKRIANEALREGLARVDQDRGATPFHIRSVSLGRILIADLGDVSHVLEVLEEGEPPDSPS